MTQHPRQLQTRARLHAIAFTLAAFFLMLTAITACEHTHPIADHDHHHTHDLPEHDHQHQHTIDLEALHKELVGIYGLESLDTTDQPVDGWLRTERQRTIETVSGGLEIHTDYKFRMFTSFPTSSWWTLRAEGSTPVYYSITPTTLHFYATRAHRSAGYDITGTRLNYTWDGDILTLTHFYVSKTGSHPTYAYITTTKWRKVGAK